MKFFRYGRLEPVIHLAHVFRVGQSERGWNEISFHCPPALEGTYFFPDIWSREEEVEFVPFYLKPEWHNFSSMKEMLEKGRKVIDYEGPIWHHLVKYLNDGAEILDSFDSRYRVVSYDPQSPVKWVTAWVKTSFADYEKALYKRVAAVGEGGIPLSEIDLEVFIESF